MSTSMGGGVDSGRREFPEAPLVGMGAVVLDGTRVLLVRRGNEPLKGEWSIPGGALELGETLHAGVRREVAEETGLSVAVHGIVEVLDKIVFTDDGRRVRYHYVLVDFLCSLAGGTMERGSDAAEARWVEREEANACGPYRLAPATAAVIEKGFAMAAMDRAHPQFAASAQPAPRRQEGRPISAGIEARPKR